MTLRIVSTPLAAPVALPGERAGGLDPAILDAVIPATGIEPVIERLRTPGVLAVTTGQQPALFTGPMYTVHKALSAAALAAELEARWGRPVVPVFWVAGDDHDFAEANHAAWPSDSGVQVATLRQRPAEAPLVPMYREPLGPEVEAAFAALEAALPPSEFREETLAWLRRHFRPEATVAAASGGALAELLAPFGVACLDVTRSAAKRLMAPWLLQALVCAHELDPELARLAGELAAAGADPGVAVGEGATLVMLEGNSGRDRLVMDGDGYRTRRGGERLSLAALEEIAISEPQRLSPNVLLRPLVESALVPTVAYVAGPGELRYLALTPPLYTHLGVHRQLAVPRWSGVLVEPRVDRVLDKFGIALEDLRDTADPVERRLVRSQLPEEATAALERLRAEVGAAYDVIERAAVSVDPTLERPVRAARQGALTGAADVEKKLVAHLRKRQETELGQIARARGLVYPDGRPQERVYTLAPFLARHGTALLGALHGAIREWYARALEGAAAGR